MNVIVSNKYNDVLQGLNIDIIKSLNGEFEVDEIIDTFKNFFFQRMILDITAIKNYKDIKNLQKLSMSLDMDKVILLLNGDEGGGVDGATSPMYLSQLISMGIYNFTRNIEGIMYLYNNPNSYRDVAQYHEINIAPKPTPADAPTQTNQGPIVTEDTSKYFSNNLMSGKNTIIGIKNVTRQSGATSLVYMMKKELERNYSVVAIEVDKRDFMFFPDKSLISTTKEDVGNIVNSNSDKEIILIDLNGDTLMEQKCNEVLYLIEPSIIKLNKLMIIEPNTLGKLSNKKVILNQSMLKAKDVLDFEYEAKLKIFYNLPPLDDREFNNGALNAFLTKLGFLKSENGEVERRKKILGIF